MDNFLQPVLAVLCGVREKYLQSYDHESCRHRETWESRVPDDKDEDGGGEHQVAGAEFGCHPPLQAV